MTKEREDYTVCVTRLGLDFSGLAPYVGSAVYGVHCTSCTPPDSSDVMTDLMPNSRSVELFGTHKI
jgi:hypothetical protein